MEKKENWYKIEKYYENAIYENYYLKTLYENYYLRTFEDLTKGEEEMEIYEPATSLTVKIIKKDIPVNAKQAKKYLTIHELDPFERELILDRRKNV